MTRSVTKSGTDTPITPIDQRPCYVSGAFQFDTVSQRGSSYRIFIYEPPGAPPKEGFPVLYLLDGNATFTTAVATAAMQSRHPDATGVPASVVVGIGYPTDAPLDIERRRVDYTPPSDAKPKMECRGAEYFSEFIEAELKPLIQSIVPIDRQRQALFGHSFGGLFTLWSLFTRPGLFQSYMAASPSIWWANRAILAHEAVFIKQVAQSVKPLRLLLTAGSLEGAPRMLAPTDYNTTMVEDAAALAERLRSQAAHGLDITFAELADETHVSVIPTALSRSVRFAW
jgi:predicted alpha/beta superfamily hydrolase